MFCLPSTDVLFIIVFYLSLFCLLTTFPLTFSWLYPIFYPSPIHLISALYPPYIPLLSVSHLTNSCSIPHLLAPFLRPLLWEGWRSLLLLSGQSPNHPAKLQKKLHPHKHSIQIPGKTYRVPFAHYAFHLLPIITNRPLNYKRVCV